MRVLLIYPPDHHMIHTNVPSVVDEETGHYPPLGLMYVASYLKAHSKHEVELLDTQVLGMDIPQIEEYVRRAKPDVVGIQAMTFTLIDARQTADAVKRADSRIHVCMGGPHVGIYPHETLQIPSVDSVVVKEGEMAFLRLVNALAEHGRENLSCLAGIESVGYKLSSTAANGTAARPPDGTIHMNPAGGFIQELDDLPMPDRTMVPSEHYDSVLAVKTPITTMMTSRGCPFMCTYCDRPAMGRRFRYRSARSVVDEMQWCQEHGVGEIFVYDDTFTVNRKRVLEITGEIRNRGLTIGWDVRTRVDMVDEELLREMRDTGCQRIHFGIESGTMKILKVFKKEIDLERAVQVFRYARRIGIQTLGYFMIGAPTETAEDIRETMRYARRLDPDYVHIAVTTPFPATELYFQALREGLYERDYWREFAANPTPDFTPRTWDRDMPKEEVWDMLDWAYKYFYRRPGYLARRLMAVRSTGELRRKVRAGLKILLPKATPHNRTQVYKAQYAVGTAGTASTVEQPVAAGR